MRIVDNQPVSTTLYNLTRIGRDMQVSGINDMKPPLQRSQDINFAQLVRYLSSIHDAKKELKPIVKALAYYQANLEDRPTIIVMVCSVQCAISSSRLAHQFLLHGTGQGIGLEQSSNILHRRGNSAHHSRRLGLFAYYDARNFASVPSEEAKPTAIPSFQTSFSSKRLPSI